MTGCALTASTGKLSPNWTALLRVRFAVWETATQILAIRAANSCPTAPLTACRTQTSIMTSHTS